MSNPNAPSPAPRWIIGLALLGLIAYGIYLGRLFVPSAGGADSSGYLNSGRLLAQGKLVTQSRLIPELTLTSPYHLVPLGFTCEPRPDSTRLAPTYPIGMPLQFAVAGRLTGWTLGPYLVCVGGALAAVWLCYLTARELGVSPLLAVVGAAALAVSPMYIFIAIQPLSDVLATTWCLAGVYAALRAYRSAGAGWALACGAACAMAVLVRPSNIVVLPAIAIFLGRWRRLPLVAIGGLPGALALGVYQHYLYGDALRSGYGSIFEIFSREHFGVTVRHYFTWVPRLLCPAYLVFPLVALWHWRERVRVLAALVLWAVAIFVFYAFYEVTHEAWWCLRFVLPGFPPLILGGLMGVEALARRWPGPRAVAVLAAAIAVWTGVLAVHWGRKQDVHGPSRGERVFIVTGEWIRDHLPANGVVASMVGSGAVFYYTDHPILRWDSMSPEDFERYALVMQRAGRPIYALLFGMENDEAMRDHLKGRWEKIYTVESANVWKWLGPS